MSHHIGKRIQAASQILLLICVTGCLFARGSQDAPSAPPAFAGFLERVQDYVRLEKSLEDGLPTLNPTKTPEKISAHQEELAGRVRQARSQARHGDIFTPDARRAFRSAIHRGLEDGRHASQARTTLQHGVPLKSVRLRVNESYPNGLPVTTFPPTLLQKLPVLPDGLAYRIVARDLVLLDTKANLVVDYIPDAFPPDAEPQ